MVSAAIPPLASLIWPPPLKFPDEIPAIFEPIITLYHQISTFFLSDDGVSVILYILRCAGTSLAIIAPAWMLLYFNKKKKMSKPLISAASFEDEVNVESPMGLIDCPIGDDEISQGIMGEIGRAADAAYIDDLTSHDAMYAEAIQLHEALQASIFTSEITFNPSSSLQQPIFNTEPAKFQTAAQHSSQSFCEICLENKESWQMFTNDRCSHSFCYNCTTSHIVAKIQDKLKDITCPALNCKATLDFDACRFMIPDDVLIQWDELLCMSLIPESQKLYCPFHDCSAMFVNDSGEVLTKIRCLVCKRSFCARCRVPWHSDFTCREFQRLYAKNGGKDDNIVKTLAKKKNWQKCPRCKMYVEKTEGCLHITCRCKYEFCYRCGSKWSSSDSHGNCRPKS